MALVLLFGQEAIVRRDIPMHVGELMEERGTEGKPNDPSLNDTGVDSTPMWAGDSEVVAAALKSFETALEEGDSVKAIDYARLLESQRETALELPDSVMVRWADYGNR